jgi:hypothetical protein
MLAGAELRRTSLKNCQGSAACRSNSTGRHRRHLETFATLCGAGRDTLKKEISTSRSWASEKDAQHLCGWRPFRIFEPAGRLCQGPVRLFPGPSPTQFVSDGYGPRRGGRQLGLFRVEWQYAFHFGCSPAFVAFKFTRSAGRKLSRAVSRSEDS